MKVAGYEIPPVFSLLIWIGLWEVAGRMDLAFILPPFSSVLGELTTLIVRHDFLAAAWQTFQAFAIGMFFAITGGIALGFIMGTNKTANSILGMWVKHFCKCTAVVSGSGC